MKLHFHGADYDRQSLNLQAVDKEVAGKYRGLNLTIHQHSVKQRNANEDQKMTYRGVPYTHD